MKKRIVHITLVAVGSLAIALLVLFLVRAKRQHFHDDGVHPVVKQVLEETADQYETSFVLEDKAGLAVCLSEAYPFDVPEWYLLTEIEQRKVKKQTIFTMDPSIDTWIFTEENDTYQYSCFEVQTIDGKETVFIRVVPNFKDNEFFSQANYNKDVPGDTLGTTPLCFADARCMWGNPTWIFVIPLASIDESYCLNYGSFSLTGADILSGSWS